MPDPMSPGMPPNPEAGGMPPPGAAPMDTGDKAPIGSSPATQPLSNSGIQAAGLAKLSIAVKLLETIIPMLGSGSEIGKAVLDTVNKLSKLVAPGTVSPGVEQSALSDIQNKARQNAMMVAAARGAMPAGAGSPPPGAGGAPGGMMPPPGLAAMMQPQGSA